MGVRRTAITDPGIERTKLAVLRLNSEPPPTGRRWKSLTNWLGKYNCQKVPFAGRYRGT
jgi:hypothetical protein